MTSEVETPDAKVAGLHQRERELEKAQADLTARVLDALSLRHCQTPTQVARALRRDGHSADDIRFAFRYAASLLRREAKRDQKQADALDRLRRKL
jgi:hypothetical protein